MGELKDLCRLCEDETKSTYRINQKALFNKDPYSKVISEILKIEIVDKEHWPTKICYYCLNTIHNIITLRKTAKASQKVFEEALKEAKTPKTSFCLSTDHSYYDTTYDNVEQDDWINPLKRKAEDDLTKECDTPVKKSTPLQVLDQNKSFDIVEITMTANDAWVIQERPIVRVRSPNPIFKPSPTWGCEYCPERFDDRDKMLWHKEDEHKKVPCGLCDELFYTEEEMKRHRKLNYDQNLCPICDEYVTDFKGHVIGVHATVEHECPVCHAKIQEVRSHLDRHMGRYIHCHICSGRYVSESKRLSHLRNSACGQLSEIKILEMRGGDEHYEEKRFSKNN